MPGVFESLTFIMLAAQAGSIAGVVAGIGGVVSALGIVGQIGIAVGLSYLSSLIFKPPEPPRPEDVQNSVKNPIASRVRHYGRVKVSGPWVFGESKSGNFHKVIALGTGELDGIEEYWVDDNLVTIDGSGYVQEDPYSNNSLRIQTRLGLSTETHYSALASEFSEWTSAHRGDGVSSLYAWQKATAQDEISERFPNLTQTLYRVVTRGSKIYNPITETTAWGDNAAAVIRDYVTHPDGMRLPSSLATTPQAAAGWVQAAQDANDAIPLKVGGTEARYRLWGSYRLDERPADVVGRMLACCDGRLVPTPDGGITLEVGKWVAPTVTIDADAITGFSDISRGRDVLSTANIVRATYMSPDHDYQSTDADQWIDEDDVALRGEIAKDTSFIMAPSHGQARRLMKLDAYRSNPNWIGSFQCNLRAMAAFGERFIRIQYPLFGIDETFEIVDFRFDIGEGGILIGVTLQVQSMSEAAYDWDAATEEGTAPIFEDTVVDHTIPEPTGLEVTFQLITVGGISASRAYLTFDAAPVASLITQARGKLTTDADWQIIPVEPGATAAVGFIVDDVGIYEFQLRYVTQTGRVGDWTDSVTVVALRSLDFRFSANSQYIALLIDD